MGKKAERIGEGAILAIPLGDGRWTLSQVYRPGIVFFILVFDEVREALPDLPALTAPPILGSWTNDAEVYRGNWKLLTHLPVTPGIFAEPEYIVLSGGNHLVESFDGNTFRPKRPGDESLGHRTSRSPRLIETATKAFFGLEQWLPYYDDMLLVPRK